VTKQSSPRDAILWAEGEIKKTFEK